MKLCDYLIYLMGRNIIKVSDKTFLSLKFRRIFKRKINWDNPKTFNEKLQWLKINDRKNLYTKLVDKIEVKEYVSKIIGEKYIIPTISTYDSFDDIDFDKLPKKFVIKCNHDSGGLVICKDITTFNKVDACQKITNSLKRNYFYAQREWPYKNVKPRILIEKYMEDKNTSELVDYKVMCFNGKPKIIFTCTDRYSDGLKVTFFDLDWNKLPFERHYPASKKNIKKPKNLKKMLELSEKLSKGFQFVRIDWYEINDELFFGEYTFYPGSGFEEFSPEEWDYKLGELLELSK